MAEIYLIAAFLLSGLLFGSFATMASYRLPRDEDLVFKRSRCVSCEHNLSFWDLLPILSWLYNFGKCRYCAKSVSIRYPLTEFVLGLLFVLIYLQFGLSLKTFSLCAAAVCLVIMVVVDFEHKIIPDSVQIALIPIGIVYWYGTGEPATVPIYGAIFGLAIALLLRYGFWILKKREGLGMGDVKFFTVAGIYLGFDMFPIFLFMSGILGICTAIVWQMLGKGKEFPFGPALAVSMLISLMTPVNEYLKLWLGSLQ